MPMIIPPLPPGARTTPRRRVDVSHKQLGGSHPDHSLPPEESVLRKEWIPDDRFVVGYAGNLGRAHDVDTIDSGDGGAAERARSRSDLAQGQFVLSEGGASSCSETSSAEANENVPVTQWSFETLSAKAAAASDDPGVAECTGAASTTLSCEGLIVPSTFYGIAAAGRPTIFIGSPEAVKSYASSKRTVAALRSRQVTVKR